jgi:uncharacterized membrane-anchored protein YhcB (DUF1043 family)
MSKNTYKYISIALVVIVVGLLVYIFTRPKQVDTVALSQDLAQFNTELQQWSATYSANPTPAGQQVLSQDLSGFAQQLKSFQ